MENEQKLIMNKITGRITFEDTNVGIPNLLISVYDLDPHTRPEETLEFNQVMIDQAMKDWDFWAKIPGDRIGSVLTDSEGQFELTYEDSEFQIRNQEKRPDLMILVTAPESRNQEKCPMVLHLSCGIRQNAGRLESFFIRLTSEQLKQAGIPIPASLPEEPEVVVKRMEAEAERENKIAEARTKIAKKKIERKRIQNLLIKNKLEKFYNSLSTVTEEKKKKLSFVKPDESVEEKNIAVIKEGIKSVVNNSEKRAPIKGKLLLTDEQMKQLKQAEDANGKISGEIVESILLKNRAGKKFPTVLTRRDPLKTICRDKSKAEECAERALGLLPSENGENGAQPPALPEMTDAAGDGIASISIETDIPRYVARLMESATTPEDPVSFGSVNQNGRADNKTLQENIQSLSLRSGPADVPALYEFHQLQIAFEPVWQEAIDQGILNIAREAYHELVELGIDPEEMLGENFECPNLNIPEKGEDASPVVISAFDITWEQWNALSTFEKGKLETVASQVLVDDMDEKIRRRLRQQGNRIISYATSKLISGTGEYDHLHKILQDLRHRLNSKYAFTEFAANCKERSVNFGILVTYRQKWQPITYQVGELVKTITLAPKEVRKISKKVVQKKKRSVKEVEKSIISHREEASEKSSAEDQIIKKAQNKTNFSMTAEGSFSVGIYGGSATTSLSKEAERSSESTKKDFRESVVKSVHEYKQERNVEIHTEEEVMIETVESGEIMNPNDEIPVTFLFYELQRRYCISEQIHQALPVIYVAQEVPKPEQINESWLAVHSWIIRRVSLDDATVIPALNYISSNVVGDEVALKELRKNVEQQRRTVEELRDQHATLHERAQYLNKILEMAIYQNAGLIEKPKDNSGGGSWWEDALDMVTDVAKYAIPGVGPILLTSDTLSYLGDKLFGSEEKQDTFDAVKGVANQATQRANELRRAIESEESVLSSLTERYSKQLSNHLNRRTQISSLLAHIKENIMYYMQAIWLHEPTDQRMCRLRNVKVPILKGKKKYSNLNTVLDDRYVSVFEDFRTYGYDVEAELEPNFDFSTLAEVADLNNLLGFMCNYMVFPLKESNALTDFMLEPYKHPEYELRDPDDSGNGNLRDFAKLVCCMKEKYPDKFNNQDFVNGLKEQYERLRDTYDSDCEEIVIPTESLYIEALPGAHPILEDFKLMHRAIDVKKVQCEVRECELENVRAAARILDKDYDDPDVDKKIVIQGNPENVIVPPEDL